MNQDRFISLLEEYPQFRNFFEKIPSDIRDKSVIIEIPSKKQTARKGEPLYSVDLLIDGKMRVLNEFENGDLYSFADLSPLAYIGSYEVVAGRGIYSATTEAQEECRMIRLPRDAFYNWFMNDADLARDIAFRLASSNCDQSYKHGELLYYPSSYLIAEYLLRMADNLEGERRRIPYGRQEMAENLGFSIRTINRCIRDFREKGLIDMERGKVTLSLKQHEQLNKYMNNIKNRL